VAIKRQESLDLSSLIAHASAVSTNSPKALCAA